MQRPLNFEPEDIMAAAREHRAFNKPGRPFCDSLQQNPRVLRQTGLKTAVLYTSLHRGLPQRFVTEGP